MTDRGAVAAAAGEIGRRDPDLGRAIEALGPLELPPPVDTAFASLVRAIMFQQISGRVALAIHARFVEALGGIVTPEVVLALPEPAFRTAGLSRAKTWSVRDLAAKAVDGTVPLHRLHELPDDEIVERLSKVRGIGQWTAQMFLIFQLHRLDVWPVSDLGVRRGYAAVHRLRQLPSERELAAAGERYRPYRTVAAWYCRWAARTGAPE